jgi:excisionase family DNA binding protein
MDKLFSVRETARYFGVSPRTVERWIAKGDIGSVLVGRQRRISEKDIEIYLTTRAQPGKGAS